MLFVAYPFLFLAMFFTCWMVSTIVLLWILNFLPGANPYKLIFLLMADMFFPTDLVIYIHAEFFNSSVCFTFLLLHLNISFLIEVDVVATTSKFLRPAWFYQCSSLLACYPQYGGWLFCCLQGQRKLTKHPAAESGAKPLETRKVVSHQLSTTGRNTWF